MKVLLDTHTFLWWNLDDPQLSAAAREIIGDGGNDILVSAATGWEIAIKYARGRLELPEPPDAYVARRLAQHRFMALPIEMSHALQVHVLPPIHRDPFDRLLVAQSQLEAIPLLSADPDIARYDVGIIW
jgi:PIN domain nuclease of toxin-antitoxin system